MRRGIKVLSTDSPVLSIAQTISIGPCQDNMNQIPSSLNSVAILLVSYRTRAMHQVQLADACREARSHTEGHASQHPSLSLFPPRRPRARASGCVAMATKRRFQIFEML
ncbi:hypothetical protein NQZ68_003567 [Dissostichus eleginoides]|nr:hypothetical protein NQZ68_003567 [Dissostichus eleginoides]